MMSKLTLNPNTALAKATNNLLTNTSNKNNTPKVSTAPNNTKKDVLEEKLRVLK